MKKLVILSLLIASSALAENICVTPSGNSGAPDCSATGALEVTSGTGVTDLGKAEDAAHTSGDVGIEMLGRVISPLASSSATGNGDYATLNLDGNGALWTVPVTSTVRICAAITPDTAAYAAGDAVLGAGPVTDPLGGSLTAFKGTILSGILASIDITNTEIDGIGWDVCLFAADPTASTTTDNAALTIVAADLQKWLGCVSVTDGTAAATTEVYTAKSINMPIKGANTSLYFVPRTKGAPTWAAAQTVNVCLTVIQD